MAAKENLTILKTLVISMGFLLVGGTVLLAGLVWKKASGEYSASACAGGHIDLKGRGAIVDSVIDGHNVIVTLARADGRNDVVTIDQCNGKILGTLTIDSDPPAADNGGTI